MEIIRCDCSACLYNDITTTGECTNKPDNITPNSLDCNKFTKSRSC